MFLTDFTTPEDIRAALGLSEEDLDSADLDLPIYVDNLVSDLEDISIDVPERILTTLAIPTPSMLEDRFLRYSRLFCTYSVAKHLTGSLPMFALKSVEDGKARMDRFESPYKDTIRDINAKFDKWKNRLEQAYGSLSSVTARVRTPRRYMSVVPPSSDPVTGA